MEAFSFFALTIRVIRVLTIHAGFIEVDHFLWLHMFNLSNKLLSLLLPTFLVAVSFFFW
ncbi:hypothetical protein SPLC1_S250020 [Arthrospira platensis C1]|nr:hypothetical protein SPLC1_S250020 [Arthrospira platensis C1]